MKKTTKQEKIDRLIQLKDDCEHMSSQIEKITENGVDILISSQNYGFTGSRVWVDDEDVVKEMREATREVVTSILKRELRSCRAKMGAIKVI